MTDTALYLRVSTAPQAERGSSLRTQEDDLRQLAPEPVAVFSDVMSGAAPDRPGFEAMLAAARRGEFDVLLVWDITRFARSAVVALTAVQELRSLGVEVRDRMGRSSGDRLVFNILTAVAEYEREAIAERSTAGRHAMAADGRLPTSHAPYGTDLDADRRLVIREDEAAWVRRAAGWIVDGATTGEAADRLNALGAPPPSRREDVRWTYKTLTQLLRQPRLHQGWVEWKGHRVPHPEVLDADLARRLAVALGERGPRRQRGRAFYPLTGLVLCPCGGIWRGGGPRNSPDRSARFYVCSRWDERAALCGWGGPVELDADWLDEHVWSAALSLVDPRRVAELLPGATAGPDASELPAARSAAAAVERRLGGLYSMIAEGTGDASVLRAEAERAETELAEARREEARLASLEARAGEARAAARSALARAAGADGWPERRSVLRDLGVRMVLLPPEGDELFAYRLEATILADPPFRASVQGLAT